jgi:hypothetical protein
MRPVNRLKYLLLIVLACLLTAPVSAGTGLDSDRDGVPDDDEIKIYHTNHFNPDTDGDGYNDWQELNSGYSPLNPAKLKLEESDYDGDGLSERMELNFHTDLANPDTDGDGYKDGQEVVNGYDPLNPEPGAKLVKRIEVNLKQQKLGYYLGGVRLGEFPVSSGKNGSTPKGDFKVVNKQVKAWSPYGLWMPYWLGLGRGLFGIHELPVWPNGYREGANHLGTPVSHGCIRLGIGPAKLIYDWAEPGTVVKIY